MPKNQEENINQEITEDDKKALEQFIEQKAQEKAEALFNDKMVSLFKQTVTTPTMQTKQVVEQLKEPQESSIKKFLRERNK